MTSTETAPLPTAHRTHAGTLVALGGLAAAIGLHTAWDVSSGAFALPSTLRLGVFAVLHLWLVVLLVLVCAPGDARIERRSDVRHPDETFEGCDVDRIDAADGAVLRVRRGGRVPPVTLLHLHPRTSATWHRVAPPDATKGFTVVCPDLSGCGASRGPDPRLTRPTLQACRRRSHAGRDESPRARRVPARRP